LGLNLEFKENKEEKEMDKLVANNE